MNWIYCLFLSTISFLLTAQTRYIDEIFSETEMSSYRYAEKDGQELILDLYQAKSDTAEARPVLIWMHGGGFAGGSRSNPDEVKLMKTLARRGFVAVSISYRLLRKGEATGFGCDCPRSEKIRIFTEAAKDFWDAVKFVYDRSEEFRIDDDKIIVGGSSAGAEAVLTAAFMKDWIFTPSNPYREIQFAGLWSLAGAVMDARYINAENAIPSVFFHGTEDHLVPYATAPHHYCKPSQEGYIILDGAKTMADRVHELGGSYYLFTLEGGRHELATIPFERLEEVLGFFHNALENPHQLTQVQIRSYK